MLCIRIESILNAGQYAIYLLKQVLADIGTIKIFPPVYLDFSVAALLRL